jgi:hypothetical protein
VFCEGAADEEYLKVGGRFTTGITTTSPMVGSHYNPVSTPLLPLHHLCCWEQRAVLRQLRVKVGGARATRQENVSHWPTAANATFVLVYEMVRASLFTASPRLIENNTFYTLAYRRNFMGCLTALRKVLKLMAGGSSHRTSHVTRSHYNNVKSMAITQSVY